MFFLRLWLAALALLGTGGARAADIDLFAAPTPTGVYAPQVLLVMDNGASFSSSADPCSISSTGVVTQDSSHLTDLGKTAAGVEQCALYSVVKSLAASSKTFNIGVMMFNAKGMETFQPGASGSSATFTSDCDPSGHGGCLVMPMTTLNSTSAPKILDWIYHWTSSSNSSYNIKGNTSNDFGGTMQEAWAYFNGKTGISGRDYSHAAPPSTSCSKYIIFLGNNFNNTGKTGDSTQVDYAAYNALSPGGTGYPDQSTTVAKRATPTATISEFKAINDTRKTVCTGSSTWSLDTDPGKGAYAVNWALYLHNHGISTYTAALENPGKCDQNYSVWLEKVPEVGGGRFYGATDYQSLVDSLQAIMGNIAAVNSVFASVSLPVSVNTQGSYLNQIFVGMFRPAAGFAPQWPGNLKQYKLGLNSAGVLKLEDADSQLAINPSTGFITECARSFWTPSTVDTYWSGQPNTSCTKIANADGSNYPDGNIVEKGAQAYRLRLLSPPNRTVKTCSTAFSSCTSLTDFSTTNASVAAALSADLINWTRGANVDGELGKTTSEMRPSAHGDVVHSRPIAINYGSDTAPSVVVYYGGNDGVLRAVNGSRGDVAGQGVITNSSSGVHYQPGDELWAFVPPESYGILSRLRANAPAISTPANASNLATQKQYGVDGPVTAFQGTIGTATKTYIYSTMRRGGRVLYAFDVTSPVAPSLLWKKGCPHLGDDTGCTPDSNGYSYAALGQTWSAPKTFYATAYGTGTPLLILGGGYDPCEDYDQGTVGGANNSCSSTKGNKVFVLNAQTGEIVKAFTTSRAVIADSTLVRDGTTGMLKYAYTADLGGNVYRITFGTGDASTWTIARIASLGCATPSSCTANRKFMFAPTVVTTDNDTYYIMLGSGDREKPLTYFTSATAVTNYFFMIKDKVSDAAWYQDSGNCGTGVMCLNSLVAITTTTPTLTQLAAKPRGWYLALASTEQVVTQAITVFGVVTFSTHQPATGSTGLCKVDLGTTNVYNISYLDAAGVNPNGSNVRFEQVAGGGLPPSPVAGQVIIDGRTVPFCIGCSKDSPLEGAPPRTLTTVTQPTGRLYWYIKK